MRFEHILFPTDFSPRAKSAEVHVRRMVKDFGSRLTILHAVEMPFAYGGLPQDFVVEAPDADEMVKGSEIAMRETLNEIAAERVVRVGDPSIVITDFAKSHGVDLIMIPTHGYGRFRRALLGSVVSKVLHDSHCAVWTDAHQESAYPSLPGVLGIVCAVDFADESVDLVRKAAGLGQALDAKVWLAHMVPAPVRYPVWGDVPFAEMGMEMRSAIEYQQDFARQQMAALQREAGTEFDVCIHAGPIAEGVADVARQHCCDVVVVGRGCAGKLMGELRSHVYGIIQQAPCPVLSF